MKLAAAALALAASALPPGIGDAPRIGVQRGAGIVDVRRHTADLEQLPVLLGKDDKLDHLAQVRLFSACNRKELGLIGKASANCGSSSAVRP